MEVGSLNEARLSQFECNYNVTLTTVEQVKPDLLCYAAGYGNTHNQEQLKECWQRICAVFNSDILFLNTQLKK